MHTTLFHICMICIILKEEKETGFVKTYALYMKELGFGLTKLGIYTLKQEARISVSGRL